MADRPEWFIDDLFPFESRFLTVDGCRIHYVDEGEGMPMLMLHGNPTWSFLYRDLISSLRETFRCIAVDYPGFGLSTAADGYDFTAAEHSGIIEMVVNELDLDGIVLVAQDWGGPIGMGAAVEDPDRYRAFVLGNTWAWPMGDEPRIRRFSSLLGSGRSGELLSQRLNLFVELWSRGGRRRRKPTKPEMQMWRGPFPTVASRRPIAVFPREIVAATPFLEDTESRLEVVDDRPVLLFHADKDPGFGWAQVKQWQEIFPDHRTHVLRGSGHYWQDDAGDEASLVIKDWWRNIIKRG